MLHSDLAHLELLAEVDALVDRLNRWADDAPAWRPAEKCRALVRRLVERIDGLRVRIEAPLVVATLGGTGTGKSALVNALLGTELVRTGRSRPTTMRPTLICRPGLTPEMLGIDPGCVESIHGDLPALRDLVLVDCPDPDTTEETPPPSPGPQCSPHTPCAERMGDSPSPGAQVGTRSVPTTLSGGVALSSNLARLRAILPHCDVLLVTATQQKYRSARVADELAAAARGTRLVFVQTHADLDDDVREDWRAVLCRPQASETLARSASEGMEPVPSLALRAGVISAPVASSMSVKGMSVEHQAGHIFRIDSLRALHDAQAGLQPRGEMADLLDLLTRQMAGAAANRIRRANFLELVADTLDSCRAKLDETMPSVRETQSAIDQQRGLLARQIAGEMQAGLLANRRQWENRLLGQAAARWGLSPFSLVLRAYQGLGGLVAGAMLYRARTPAQMALWGALEGTHTWRRWRRNRRDNRGLDRAAAAGWDPAKLRKAAVIIEGYATEAGLSGRHSGLPGAGKGAGKDACPTSLAAESEATVAGFVARVSAELESLVARLVRRQTGWLTRSCYEMLLAAMLGLLLYRLAKNFFYDSWLADRPATVYGINFYLSAGFWLALWCLVLLWMFCGRLRRGLRGAITQLAAGWQDASSAAGLFAGVETNCRRAERFRRELDVRSQEVETLRRQLAAKRLSEANPVADGVGGTP